MKYVILYECSLSYQSKKFKANLHRSQTVKRACQLRSINNKYWRKCLHFLKPWEWNKPIVAFCTSDNLFLFKEPVSFFLAWNDIIYVLGANLQLPPSWFFYLVKINRKNVSQFTKQFLAIVFILIFGIDSVFQNHAIEINGEMYKNIDTPIKFLRKNNEFLFL